MLIMRFSSYDLLFYGGILMMGAAGIFFVAQTIFYITKRSRIHKKLDEEYGQPQKYHMRENHKGAQS